jgi:sulfite reductase (ferredoxin)
MTKPLTPVVQEEIKKFGESIQDYRAGKWEKMAFKAHRTLHGIYGQRQDDVNMIRVKVPGGEVNTTQLKGLSIIAKDFANGFGHITTRQAFQFYFMKLEDSPKVMEILESHGLTSREACANAVRNICGSPLSGIFPGEPFDTLPYNLALFQHILRHPDFNHLPRKFKVNFACSEGDHSQAAMNCVGFVAKMKDGKRGFKVLVGGGLGAVAHEPKVFSEFIAVDQMLPYIESILHYYDQNGDRKNRSMARIKYLVAKDGIEKFKAEVEKIYQARTVKSIPIEVQEQPIPNTAVISGGTATPAFETWKKFSAFPQKQPGYVYVWIKLPWGVIPHEKFSGLAQILEKFGNGTLRTSNHQNFVIPWVRPESLPALYEALVALGMKDFGVDRFEDVVSCPGGYSCNLAITKSRNLGLHLSDYLQQKYPCNDPVNEDLKDVHVKISGCPNSCGQHRVASIGFQGAFSLIEKKQIPVYQVYWGGQLGLDFVKIGAMLGKVPARRADVFLDRVIALYRSQKNGRTFAQWQDAVDRAEIKALCSELMNVTLKDTDMFKEPMEQEDFAFTGFGEAECGVPS